MKKYQKTANQLPQLLEQAWVNHENRLKFAYAVVKCLSQPNILIPQQELFHAIIRQRPIQKGKSDYQKSVSEAFITAIQLARGETYVSLEALKYQLKKINQLYKKTPEKITSNTKNLKNILRKKINSNVNKR